MIHVANPIYDIIFKYLMEDERIAKTVLSALLKKEVIEVEMRPHEYADSTRDNLSVFRIDFGARVREENGDTSLILIELQKTWLETETLRFRQYLGAQYASPNNMLRGNKQGFAYPMVTVYLLGHRVGDIEEPVLYVKRKSFNYDGQEVTRGIPDPFVDSLTHDSIIVQIPLLKGRINNRVEKVLSIFDQSRQDENNHQMLNIDESLYADDEEMLHIIHRLLRAASDAALRHNMNVEDEYFSAIENRDTEILMRDKLLAEQGAQLKEQGAQLKEQGAQLKEQGAQLKEQGAQLKEQDEKIRTSVKLLLQAGVAKDVIAMNLGRSLEEIDQIARTC